jgi:hypothetical protein
MAKGTKGNKVEETNLTDEPRRSDLNFGEIPNEMEQQLKEVDPLQNIPTFVPGKPGFEEGDKLGGYYVGTKRVYSDKFTAGKRDETGRIYRDLHILRHPKHGRFGIWSVGSLGFVMERLAPNEYIVVEYTGLAEKALKPGQSAPHTFRFKGVNLDLDTNTMGNADELEGRTAGTGIEREARI